MVHWMEMLWCTHLHVDVVQECSTIRLLEGGVGSIVDYIHVGHVK